IGPAFQLRSRLLVPNPLTSRRIALPVNGAGPIELPRGADSLESVASKWTREDASCTPPRAQDRQAQNRPPLTRAGTVDVEWLPGARGGMEPDQRTRKPSNQPPAARSCKLKMDTFECASQQSSSKTTGPSLMRPGSSC